MSTRRERLRGATAADHAVLDGLVERSGLLASRAGYARFLRATWRARRRLEAGLDRSDAGRLFPAWRHTRIAPLLQADYGDVAGHDLPVEAEARPPDLSPGGVFGTLYVLEGSALGAKTVIRIAESLGYSAAFGARHLAHQVGSISGFRSFLAALELATLGPGEEEACLRAARAAFSLFQTEYERISVEP